MLRAGCVKLGRLDAALAVLDEDMRSDGVAPDTYVFNEVLSGCVPDGKWGEPDTRFPALIPFVYNPFFFSFSVFR